MFGMREAYALCRRKERRVGGVESRPRAPKTDARGARTPSLHPDTALSAHTLRMPGSRRLNCAAGVTVVALLLAVVLATGFCSSVPSSDAPNTCLSLADVLPT